MENPALSGQIKTAFIGGACLFLAVFLGYLIGTEDYGALLIGVVGVAVCYLWFFSGRFFWVLTIASSSLSGTFPILRAEFTPFQLLMAMGLVKFAVEDVILRRTRLRLPGRFDLIMIAGFMSIILLHGFQDRFGMRFLGSTVWGGRHYVNVFVGLIAFFVIQSIPTKPGLWAKFPYVVLAVVGFDFLIALITTIVPTSIYLIYPFYSAVSMSSLQEVIGGSEDVTGRVGAFGNFGFVIVAIVLATISFRALLHPSNLGRLVAIAAGSLGVLFSGYRSAVLNTFLLIVTAGIRDLRAGAILLLPALAGFFFTLSIVNSEVVTLPKQVQRGLAFLPGDWDMEMARDAHASNDFRFSVWTLWWKQYFPEHPIIGRGFGFRSQWTQKSLYYGDAADHQQMVEVGNIHNGFLAALDTFGILGMLFFVPWSLVMLIRALRVRLGGSGGDHFALRFLALYLAVWIVSYWVGAQSVGSFLPQQFALTGLFLRLQRDMRERVPAPRPLEPAMPKPFRRTLAQV